MRKKRDNFEEVKAMVGQRLDWNLQYADVVGWGVKDGRLHVILIDRCPLGMDGTRDYMECVSDLAMKHKIDVTVFHRNA
jgi:hypothetical protein